MASNISVIIPSQSEKAYTLAGEAFCTLWQQVTGCRPALQTSAGDLPSGARVLIGSDAVNSAVHDLIMRGLIAGFKIRYGTDDYQIESVDDNKNPGLILAGASGRSSLYAVYDFFERRAGARYFWDGDIIPHAAAIDLKGCHYCERPRFTYRGLRYFAHRGLHRFQAEHWNLEDWKKEIDWLLKKRLNLFMLRIGIDDLFQRAFPEHCPYPPTDGIDPDARPRSFDDRTSFWPLKYRGEMRKQVLQYAFDRGLIHPEDVGTITHWYSHTPSSFYQKQPDFPLLKQTSKSYNTATGKVWDINDDRAWQSYWKLTQTHIREFGKPQMFHTIGLAERRFGKDDAENLQIKLFAYRKIQAILREHYPDAPLLMASWDLILFWKNTDVRRLLQELDPSKTIILDYTADHPRSMPYKAYGYYRKFPWIFGVFHAFESGTELGSDYAILKQRFQDVDKDPFCRGIVLWAEVSHTDTFLLEYLAANSWQPRRLALRTAIRLFCRARYPQAEAASMARIWRTLFAGERFLKWNIHRSLGMWSEPHFRLLSSADYSDLTPERIRYLQREYALAKSHATSMGRLVLELAALADRVYDNHFWLRDAVDLSRTVLNHTLRWTFVRLVLEMDAWRREASRAEAIAEWHAQATTLLTLLGELLAQHNDYSLYHSFQKLAQTATINPHTEQTLKGNAENNYCRTDVYELVRHVYSREFEVFFGWIDERMRQKNVQPWRRPESFDEKRKAIQEIYYATPLSAMAPKAARSAPIFSELLFRIGAILNAIRW